MGHPKSSRKKFSKPMHPWQKERIDEEKSLMKDIPSPRLIQYMIFLLGFKKSIRDTHPKITFNFLISISGL